MSERLPDDMAAALAANRARLGSFAHLTYLAETDSTNDVALNLATAGAPEGTAVLADLQRAGRGRRGRTWFSPPGAGLYLSVVVRPGEASGPLSFVTLAAGVAAADAIAAVTSLPIELKWPNDVVVGRPRRKLAGVLCESSGVGGRVDAIVIGTGVNLRPAAYPREIADRATSIETELGRPIERASLVIECLARLRDTMDAMRHGRRDEVAASWRRWGSAGLDRTPVRWMDHGHERRGVAVDLDPDGALVVECDGRRERVIAGEVLWDGVA